MAKDYPAKMVVAGLIVFSCLGYHTEAAQYLGKFLGKLSELHHGVSGEVYAVDARTLHIKDFTYDGQGPAAYFFATAGRRPDSSGFRIRDENGNPEVLRRYRKEGVTITLPDGKTLNSIKFFYIWCEEFEVNFGDIKIPRNFDYPRPQKIDGLRGVHGVASDNIVIVDAQTLLVPNLSYDGEAPDAKFWVGSGPKPSPQGIRVPDENGKEVPLRRYDRKTVVLTLPGDQTVFDIGHFGVWCEAFTVDFGHVQIPHQQLNVPPSLKMLGVSPQKRPRTFDFGITNNQPQQQGGSTLHPQQQQQILPQQRVEVTTYRPQARHFNVQQHLNQQQQQLSLQQQLQLRRNDQPNHEVVNRDIYSRGFTQNLVNPGFLNHQLQPIQFQQQKIVNFVPQNNFGNPQPQQIQQSTFYNHIPHGFVNNQNSNLNQGQPPPFVNVPTNQYYQQQAILHHQNQQQFIAPASFNQIAQPNNNNNNNNNNDQQKLQSFQHPQYNQNQIQQREDHNVNNNHFRQGIPYTPFTNLRSQQNIPQQHYGQLQQVNHQFVADNQSVYNRNNQNVQSRQGLSKDFIYRQNNRFAF